MSLRLGFALMRDRRIPIGSKLASLLVGLAVTSIVEFLEIPVESVIAVLLPLLGAGADFALDGAELVAGPLILGTLMLPMIAPRKIVDEIRAERAGASGKGPIIDV